MLRDEIVYRLARPSDAADLAAFGSEAFVAAYGHTLKPGNLALHVARTYSEELQRVELEAPGCWTLVADREGEIVAAALARWNPPPAALAPELRWAEIARFYVRGSMANGVSSDLMVAALREIQDREGAVVWLQAWEQAERALRFYRKWGFLEVAETTFKVGTEVQRDLVLARSLHEP